MPQTPPTATSAGNKCGVFRFVLLRLFLSLPDAFTVFYPDIRFDVFHASGTLWHWPGTRYV